MESGISYKVSEYVFRRVRGRTEVSASAPLHLVCMCGWQRFCVRLSSYGRLVENNPSTMIWPDYNSDVEYGIRAGSLPKCSYFVLQVYGRALSNYEYRYRRRKNYGSLSLWKCLVLEHIASTRSNESLTRYNLPGCIGRTILAGSAGVVVADTLTGNAGRLPGRYMSGSLGPSADNGVQLLR